MRWLFCLLVLLVVLSTDEVCNAAEAVISDETQECLDCHSVFHPGIVADWQKSRHAVVNVKDALAVEGLSNKVSSKNVPEALTDTAVGCAECHMLNAASHKDTFEHNGYDIHVVVSPKDCAVCHTQEAEEYSQNLMSHAYANLAENPLYQDLQRSIIGTPVLKDSH